MAFPHNRFRRLRHSAALRSLVQENYLHTNNFLCPLFITEGTNIKELIATLPNQFRLSIDEAENEVKALWQLGIKAVLLFVKVPENLKDNAGKEAVNPNGLMQRSIQAIKNAVPEMAVFTDVALDPYSIYGHDGIVENFQIINDTTSAVLAEMALSHAQAGADFVAPSDMMDGRVKIIREALEYHGFHHTGILSYSAKYASCFYGPFRDALDSAPGFGDKKTYQMNIANSQEALKETLADIEEGADMVMIKPAMPYLDVVRKIKDAVLVPVAAYQVSGEYAMIKLAAEKGIVNHDVAMIESLMCIKRAGADIIATYFAKEAAQWLQSSSS